MISLVYGLASEAEDVKLKVMAAWEGELGRNILDKLWNKSFIFTYNLLVSCKIQELNYGTPPHRFYPLISNLC